MEARRNMQPQASQYGLEEVYSPSSKGVQAVANIIFVHGLFGGRKTWTAQRTQPSSHTTQQPPVVPSSSSRPEKPLTKGTSVPQSDPGSVFWPGDLLPLAIPDARVFTWNYDADVHHWTSSASQNTIHQHAGNLLSDLAYLIAGDMPEPLIFVVHSLGGIVVKDALNQSSQTEGTRLKNIAPATFGVLFLGTPHRGSKSASMGRLAYNVTVAATRRPNLKLLQALERNSETLDRVGDGFRQTVLKFDIKFCSFREEKETRKYLIFNTMVVEPESAKIGDGKEEIGSIPENHRHMSKFSSNSDIGFKRVSAVLRTWIDDIKRSGKIHPTEGYHDCLVSLDSAESKLRIKNIVESDEETFQWLYDREQVQFAKWLQHDGEPGTQIFWIQGKPGSGKSTLMKFAMSDTRTLELLQTANRLQWIYAGFFFHDRGSLAQKTFPAMLKELLNQMLCGTERLWLVVKPIYEELTKKQRTKFPSWDVDTLQTVLIAISELRYLDLGVLFFLDALDEHDGDKERLTRLVWKLVQNSAGTRLKFKICLASRPWPVFTSSFSNCSGFVIHDHTRDDIHIYTNRKLREATMGLSVPQKNKVYPQKLHDISEQVTDRARGVFIWVRLVVNELSKGLRDGTPLSVLEQKLSEMPSELKDLYIHTLRRIEGEYLQETMIMLQLALCSFSPLPLGTFLACSSYARWKREHEFETKDTMIRHLASRSGGLLEVFSAPSLPAERDIDTVSIASILSSESHSRVQFIHQTVKDFVAHGDFSTGFLGDAFTLHSGYLYLLRYGARNGASVEDEITRDMFRYAKAIEKHSPQELELMKTVLDDIWCRDPPGTPFNQDLARKWIGLIMSESHVRAYYLQSLSLLDVKHAFLHLAIGANLVEYVRYIHYTTDDKKVFGDKAYPNDWLKLAIAGPSLVAGQEDRVAMVKLLLELGVSPDGEIYMRKRMAMATPLRDLGLLSLDSFTILSFILSRTYEIAEESRYAIVSELLKHGASPDTRVRIGAKPDNASGPFQTYGALEHVVGYESADMIKLFLRHNATRHGIIRETYDHEYNLWPLLPPIALLRRDIGAINSFRGHIPHLTPDTETSPPVVDTLAIYSLLGALAI
ncbi:hypothetical protein MMC17_008137 [Xylographa soralifera]|nr:hypothetical protein [Xylographa soralifera]